MERHSNGKHIVQYDAIQQKNNKDNKKAFNMMWYCIIESYAYDVTNDVMKNDVIKVWKESREWRNVTLSSH